jgi:triosephosphate isomerase (TIM)
VVRPVFIVNFKNYQEVLGMESVKLALEAERVARDFDLEMIVAPPIPMLSTVAGRVKIPVFSQKVDVAEIGKSTGAVVPEAVKAAGAAGSLVNHSEARVGAEAAATLVKRMKGLRLSSCVCAENVEELVTLSELSPEYVAVEPPELIGTGVAVSKARPELIGKSVEAARDSGYRGRVLCGAGITSGDDVKAARRAGTGGILVASSIVKSRDWNAKLTELCGALLSANA